MHVSVAVIVLYIRMFPSYKLFLQDFNVNIKLSHQFFYIAFPNSNIMCGPYEAHVMISHMEIMGTYVGLMKLTWGMGFVRPTHDNAFGIAFLLHMLC